MKGTQQRNQDTGNEGKLYFSSEPLSILAHRPEDGEADRPVSTWEGKDFSGDMSDAVDLVDLGYKGNFGGDVSIAFAAKWDTARSTPGYFTLNGLVPLSLFFMTVTTPTGFGLILTEGAHTQTTNLQLVRGGSGFSQLRILAACRSTWTENMWAMATESLCQSAIRSPISSWGGVYI
jgi:hypothetical protein